MDLPEAVRMAMAKAKEYKKNKGTIENNSSIVENSKLTGMCSRLTFQRAYIRSICFKIIVDGSEWLWNLKEL